MNLGFNELYSESPRVFIHVIILGFNELLSNKFYRTNSKRNKVMNDSKFMSN